MDHLNKDARKLVRKYCTGSVLDLGAGCGALAQYLPKEVTYLGVEVNLAAVELAREKGRNVILGDIRSTNIRDSSYETCTMLEVLEHVEDYELVLTEARRVCSSHLVVTVPNIGVLPALSEYQVVPWHLLEATHVNFFTAVTLQKLLLKFFRRADVREMNEWFRTPLLRKLRRRASRFHMNISAVAWK